MKSDYSATALKQPFLRSILSKKEDIKSIEDYIIDGCIADSRKAQKALYNRYSPTMLGICLRYSKSTEEAEDVMQDGFIKVFKHIKSFRRQGSFEGWIKRIIINTALNSYHKNKKNLHKNIEEINENKILNNDNEKPKIPFTQVEMLEAIHSLPKGYSMIFNLYVFEKYKHREIAEMLNVSVNTSKSQLSKARTYLQKVLAQIAHRKNNNT